MKTRPLCESQKCICRRNCSIGDWQIHGKDSHYLKISKPIEITIIICSLRIGSNGSACRPKQFLLFESTLCQNFWFLMQLYKMFCLQVAGLVSCCLLLVVLLAIAPLFYSLPKVNTRASRSAVCFIRLITLLVGDESAAHYPIMR